MAYRANDKETAWITAEVVNKTKHSRMPSGTGATGLDAKVDCSGQATLIQASLHVRN